MIYLDYNATAPLWPAARAAMLAALDHTGNASSVHRAGQAARAGIEQARQQVAAAVGAPARSVLFTSGGSEANALALASAGSGAVLVSAIEHDSVLAQAPAAERIPVMPAGTIDLDALSARLTRSPAPALVSVMAANNETGVVQPLEAVAALVRGAGARLHVDATQALGKLACTAPLWGADLLTVSAHKIGGPSGVGALVLAPGMAVPPLIRGGGQEFGLRAGTENRAGISGFGAAVAAISAAAWQQPCAALRDRLEARIAQTCPDALVIAPGTHRLCNTSCLWMPGVAAELQVVAFDLAGFAVSAGSACASGKLQPSPVLLAMGRSPEVAAQAIRVSLGWQTSAAEVDAFADAWSALHARRGRQGGQVAA